MNMQMHKKAQGISINTVIIAVIALAVLVVLFFIFTGRFKIFSEGVKEGSLSCDRGCKTVGNALGRPSAGCNPADETQLPGKYEDVPQGQLCCCVANRV